MPKYVDISNISDVFYENSLSFHTNHHCFHFYHKKTGFWLKWPIFSGNEMQNPLSPYSDFQHTSLSRDWLNVFVFEINNKNK